MDYWTLQSETKARVLFACRRYISHGENCPHSGKEFFEKRKGPKTEPWGKHAYVKVVRGRGVRDI